ncbi:MAG: AbrB/MazE/SpoVT family DNA-binding domain-containing protein [Candidatus Diapherotrites archaeon]|nr:AbrB/MazE/SpoVT family DNA-binding domain-containing protein [Candidatus Diapherotrites archaeon]
MQPIVETTKMSTKGQIIIPKEVRDFTQSKENTLFTVTPVNTDTIILKKLNRQEMVKEFQKIRQEVKGKLSEDEINDLIHKVR